MGEPSATGLTPKQLLEELHTKCGVTLEASMASEFEALVGPSALFCSDLGKGVRRKGCQEERVSGTPFGIGPAPFDRMPDIFNFLFRSGG
jgi:hypothetical protein